MSELERLLRATEAGEPGAEDALYRLVHDELHKLADQLMARERPGHTLQPTALINESFVKLMRGKAPLPLENGRFFYAAAGKAMQEILCDHARRRKREKRGGQLARQEMVDDHLAYVPETRENLLDLNAALEALAVTHPKHVKLVQLVYFAGLSLPDAAQVLDIPYGTARKWWDLARAKLRRHMGSNNPSEKKDENL